MASRFAQTFLRVPECVDANPVKVAFSIAKVIVEIRRELLSLYLWHKLTNISGDNNDELSKIQQTDSWLWKFG